MVVMKDPESLLIVDDEEINRAILANLFQAEYQILEAANGREALAVLHQHQDTVSAVLLDVIMPEMDGIEVLRRLHDDGLTQRFPVFLITADSADATMREAYRLGVMDIIFKPVVPYIVQRRVNSIVELYRARRQLGATVEQQRDQLLVQTQQLAAMGMGMVEALATAIEFRSDESGQHVRRIRDITCHLLRHTALGAGFTDSEIQLIGVGAITHDVGKISIPDAILHKPGRLTPEEFSIIQSHTVNGAKLLSHIPQMRQHRPASPRTVGRPGLSRRVGGQRHPHLDPDRSAGRCLRRAGQPPLLQGPPACRPGGTAHSGGSLRRLQSGAAGRLHPV